MLDWQTIPGADGALTHPARHDDRDAITRSVELLRSAHATKAIAVIAHETCAGHPVDNRHHASDVQKAAQELRRLLKKYKGPITAFVLKHESDADWELVEVGTA